MSGINRAYPRMTYDRGAVHEMDVESIGAVPGLSPSWDGFQCVGLRHPCPVLTSEEVTETPRRERT